MFRFHASTFVVDPSRLEKYGPVLFEPTMNEGEVSHVVRYTSFAPATSAWVVTTTFDRRPHVAVILRYHHLGIPVGCLSDALARKLTVRVASGVDASKQVSVGASVVLDPTRPDFLWIWLSAPTVSGQTGAPLVAA